MRTLIMPVGEFEQEITTLLKIEVFDRIVIILEKEKESFQKTILSKLKKVTKAEIEIILFEGDVWEESFKHISELRRKYGKTTFLNSATASKDFLSAMVAAAFINGMIVFSKKEKEYIIIPPYKFSYFHILTDKKKEIMDLLYSSPNEELSLENISERTKMSLPLISYHINGNIKSPGLKELGLVTSREEKGRSYIKLSLLAKLLIKGYIE